MTEKQKRFCDEYLKDLNAKQAAVRAGYSPKTAKQIGQRMLTFVDLKSYRILTMIFRRDWIKKSDALQGTQVPEKQSVWKT